MVTFSDGSDRSYSEPSSDDYRRTSSPAEDDADEEAVDVSSRPRRRRARAGAGARLKDLLQQEAKDLRVRVLKLLALIDAWCGMVGQSSASYVNIAFLHWYKACLPVPSTPLACM